MLASMSEIDLCVDMPLSNWADPATRSSFAFVHNRLVTPIVVDQILFVPLILQLRRAIAAAHRHGPRTVPRYGAPYSESVG